MLLDYQQPGSLTRVAAEGIAGKGAIAVEGPYS